MNFWERWMDRLRGALGLRATRTSDAPDFPYKQVLRDIFEKVTQGSEVFVIEDRDEDDFILRSEHVVLRPSFDQRDQYLDLKLFGTEHYEAMEAERNAFEGLRLYDQAYDLRSLSESIRSVLDQFDIRNSAGSVVVVSEALSILVSGFPQVLIGDVPRSGEGSKVRIWERGTGWREAEE